MRGVFVDVSHMGKVQDVSVQDNTGADTEFWL